LCTFGGWEGHTPKESMEIMINLLKKEGFQVDVVETMDPYCDEKYME